MSDATSLSPLLRMSMPQVLLKVALPATASFMLNTVFGLVDAFWVGRLGSEAMAALSASSVVTWILLSLGSLGQVGAQAIVSQAIGARDEGLARRAVWAALLLHAAVAAVALAPLWLLDGALFGAMGLAPEVARGASDYLHPFLAGMAVHYLGMVAMAAFHATGNTRTPALVLGAALLLNGALDPLLIFGWGPVPALGLQGAGVATSISKAVMAGALLWLLHRRGLLDLSIPLRNREMAALARQVLAAGLPIALNGVVFSGVYLVLIRILSGFGTVPVATLGIVHRIENVAWFACVGFGVAAAALGGQLAGANRSADAVRAVWHVNLWLSAGLLVVSAGYALFGGPLVGLFSDDPAVVEEGARYLVVIACCEVLLGWEVIFQEAMGAVGSSRAVFAIATPLTLLRIPLAWLLVVHLGMGAGAVWWAISLTTGLKGLGLAAAFTFGGWRHRGSLAARLAASPGTSGA